MLTVSKLRAFALILSFNFGFELFAQTSEINSSIRFSSELEGEYMPESNSVILRKNAQVILKDLQLNADIIEIDWTDKTLTAFGVKQNNGEIKGKPQITQGDRKFGADTLKYNYETKQGWIFKGNTTESDGFLHGEKIKMITDSSYFLGQASFTSCNHEHPHFAIVANKARLDVGKQIVTGPAFLQILDIPTPLFLPFAFFPIMEKRASGYIIPKFSDRREWGLGLLGGGYYWALNDHIDLRVTGDIYSRGSWGVNASSGYKYRYRYSGNLGFQYNRTTFGDPRNQNSNQFMDARDFRISWSHSQDPKAHPTQQFNARVELATGTFFRNTTTNPSDFQKNDMSSSVSYSKRWKGSPFNLTAAARHRQNNQNGTITLSLPEVNIGMSRIQPFARKNPVGAARWYEKIGMTYSMSAKNETQGLLSEIQTPSVFFNSDRLRAGVNHKANLGTNLKLLRFITLNPNANYQERWYPYALNRNYDTLDNSLVTDTLNGFYAARDFALSAGASTTIYGIFSFKKGPLKAIRHVMYPSLSWRFAPDFTNPIWNSFQTVQVDSIGTFQTFSKYQGFIYGAPGVGNQGGVNLRLRNTFDGKWLGFSDSNSVKKFNILEDFTLQSNYNPTLDSNPLSPVSVRASTSFLKSKFRISYQGSFDWYSLDSLGLRTQNFAWKEGQGPLRPTLHQFSMNLRLRGGSASGRPVIPLNEFGLEKDLFPNYYDPMAYMDWAAPWTFNVGYSLRRSNKPGSLDMTTIQSLRFDGSWEPTSNWRLAITSGYDIQENAFTYTTLDVLRQLHCWEMRIRWVPFGYARSYNIGIGVKAPLMNSLKLDRRRGIGDY